MGTINYRSNDFITLGIRPYTDDITEESDLYDLNPYEDDFFTACDIIAKYDFEVFDIKAEPGYYEGFYIDINFDYLYFDDCIEKADANKEINQVKKMFIELAEAGLVAVHPGWCTGYEDYNGTKAAINQAVKKMRAAVKATPCYVNWKKAN